VAIIANKAHGWIVSQLNYLRFPLTTNNLKHIYVLLEYYHRNLEPFLPHSFYRFPKNEMKL